MTGFEQKREEIPTRKPTTHYALSVAGKPDSHIGSIWADEIVIGPEAKTAHFLREGQVIAIIHSYEATWNAA